MESFNLQPLQQFLEEEIQPAELAGLLLTVQRFYVRMYLLLNSRNEEPLPYPSDMEREIYNLEELSAALQRCVSGSG